MKEGEKNQTLEMIEIGVDETGRRSSKGVSPWSIVIELAEKGDASR
jgi:hypothetical protein